MLVTTVGTPDNAQRILPLTIIAAAASGAPCPPGITGPMVQAPKLVLPVGLYKRVFPLAPRKKAFPLGKSRPAPTSPPMASYNCRGTSWSGIHWFNEGM